MAGKYTLIEIDYAADDEEEEEQPAKKARTGDLQRANSSKLSKPVQDLMNLIFDMKMMEKSMTELEFDIKKQPLGRLSKKTLKDGYQVLKEIDEVISGTTKGDLTALSSRFYTLIPHTFGMKRPPVIRDKDTVAKKLDMIQQLVDIEVAATIMKGSSGGSALDQNYEKLNCHIEAIDKKSDEFKRIAEYVNNTYHRGKAPTIVNVYALERDGEHDRFAQGGAKLGNRKLLWHGSRLTNFVGILSQGLRIAPPEAPVSGYRFGKGLYFADMCGLSALYCRSAGLSDVSQEEKTFCSLSHIRPSLSRPPVCHVVGRRCARQTGRVDARSVHGKAVGQDPLDAGHWQHGAQLGARHGAAQLQAGQIGGGQKARQQGRGAAGQAQADRHHGHQRLREPVHCVRRGAGSSVLLVALEELGGWAAPPRFFFCLFCVCYC